MPVKKEASGRRSVEAETEVAGTPEEVWRAIASGPGIASWFVPTKLDGRVGGLTESSFGPGMDGVAKIVAWEPPRRFVAESDEGPGTVATEWSVEASAGGTCTVRVVHSWFASTDDWDHQYEGHSFGWISYFRILKLYMEHFRGEPCAPVQLMAMFTGRQAEGWQRLVEPLGLATATVGARVSSPDGVPPLVGIVEGVNPPDWPGVIIRLQQPAPATAHFFAMAMGQQVMLPVRFYLYGDAGVAAAKEVEATWREWLGTRFPPG